MSHQPIKLRRHLRQERRRISIFQQRQSQQHILTQICQLPAFKYSQHIGVYLAAFGEIYTNKIILECFKRGKRVYLPMICNMNQHLVWVRITQQQYLSRRFAMHRLGMQQAMQSRGISVKQLDLLVMPLLACDHLGTRLGMGGGFYDKTLARATQKPYRLGLAHDFQLLDTPLIRQAWDQPLDALLTPQHFVKFQR
jgi:5-formyltetrahydrofolate cyclo-ligase